VINIKEEIELVKRVLINIKKEGVLLRSSSSLLLLLLLLPLKSIIYYLYPLLKRLLKLSNLILNQLRFLDLN
jgi:hypothetical protein